MDENQPSNHFQSSDNHSPLPSPARSSPPSLSPPSPHSQVVDFLFMLKALAVVCSVFASTFTLLVFCSCGWLFILFKVQQDLYVMMPPETYWNFQMFLTLAFFAQCIHLVDLLHSQVHTSSQPPFPL